MNLDRMFDIRLNTLDAGGNRRIEIALPTVQEHPERVGRVLQTKGPYTLHWTASCGEHTKRGDVDLKHPVISMVFQKGVDPDGTWEVQIDGAGADGAWTRRLWRQLIFVQKEFSRTQKRIAELAQEHAPVFVFSCGEQYFPVSLETLLRSPLIRERTDAMTIETIFGKESVPLADLGDFLRFNGHADYLLDFNFLTMWRSVFAQMGGDPRAATVYYSYLEDPQSDRFFINYHLIYAFDTKTGVAKWTGLGPHVFDRESMVLVFHADESPKELIISGHLENQFIFFLNKRKMWNQGRVSVPYDDPRTLKLGTHPVVAVAEGSHALYPTSGVYRLSLLKEIAGYLDDEALEGHGYPEGKLKPEQLIVPPSLSTDLLPQYALRPFRFDCLTSRFEQPDAQRDPHTAFLTFSGHWVDVLGPQNARFPPFTRKVSEIEHWVDGAYAWDWGDVPERYQENNDVILEYLAKHVHES